MPTIQGSGTFTFTLDVTPEMMKILQRIARESNQPLDAVFTRAIALYQAALNAKAEGKHIGYAHSTDGLEAEFTGLTGPGSE